MLNKDLLLALQTRSKRMIRELEKFTGNCDSVSPVDGWTFFMETVKLARELPPTHDKYSHIVKAVNGAWLAVANQSDAAADKFYGYVTECLEQTNWLHEDEAQAGYQLLYAFHDTHMRYSSINDHVRHGLRQHSPRILALIRHLLPYSKQILFRMPVKPDRGVGADAIDMLLDVHFYHTGLAQGEDLRAEAADLLPALIRADPHIGNNLALCLLRSHPERADICGQLIELYIEVGESACEFGMFYNMMLELVDNDGSSFVYADLDKITKRLAVSSAKWTSEQMEFFTRFAFFYRLKSDEDRRLLLAKSAKVRRLARMIVDSKHAGTHIDALRSLYNELGAEKPAAPKAPKAPKVPKVRQFKDLNLKLLVIDDLMYGQEILLPRFDLEEFVKQYTAREIMIEQDGYDVIPEALQYFEALVIPPELLARVEELNFDGGAEIYSQIFPHWDGECDTFDVGSIKDIGLLPNLKRMSDMPDAFIERHAAALRKRGIETD